MPSTDTQFKPGEAKGRPPGVKNKLTRTVKQAVLDCFNELQEDPKHNLLAFAKKYPRDFYNISAKLIPSEITADVTSAGEKITPTIILQMPNEDRSTTDNGNSQDA